MKLGGKVYHGYFKVQHPFKNLYSIYKTVKKGGYIKVFIFTQHPIAFLDLSMVALGGGRVRVVRSTNSACGGTFSNWLAVFFRPLMNLLVSQAVAPSKEAGIWLFGKRKMRSGKVTILNNGLDTNVYYYSEDVRNETRNKWGIKESAFVVGHVGRFNQQKNHLFLIDVFAQICIKRKDAHLLLVGKGETMPDVEQRIKDLGIKDRVTFLGVRDDVAVLLNAMDVLIFPSLYEGMPNVIIEAQACGLPCLLSDTISKDAAITKLVEFESLNSIPSVWADHTLRLVSQRPRHDTSKEITEKGYSISSTVEFLEKIFS